MRLTCFHNWFGLLAMCVILAGCQRQRTFAPTYAVRGSVTLDKKPLAEGKIAFISPESGDLQDLSIKDGRYDGQVRAGTRRVEIRAYRPRKGQKSRSNRRRTTICLSATTRKPR